MIMENRWRAKAGKHIILIVILCGSLVLLLANLGNQYLWTDEAQTALLSKTILTEGVPRGYDGKNFFSQEFGAEYGKNYIWRLHTWLPFYVLAGFYKVFGVSTFVSRLPFALFGFGTVVLTYFSARALWPGSRAPAIAAGLLAVSVPFLLLSRQCRYYSLATFFFMLSLYAYVALTQRRRYSGVLLFISSTMLFHSLHIYIVALYGALLVHAIIFHRDRLVLLTAAMAATILFNLPWLIWMSGMNRDYLLRLQHGFILKEFMKIYARDIIKYAFPLWLLAIGAVAAIARVSRRGYSVRQGWTSLGKAMLPVLLTISNVVVIAIFAPTTYFRYLSPVIPLLILITAVIIDAVADLQALLAVATAVILIATGQLNEYLYEITHDYDGPEEGIARYLNEHGSIDDIVAVDYGDMSLKFYTKMRVVGGLTGEDLEPAKNARWVVIRKADIGVRGQLLEKIDLGRYRQIVLDYPDIAWENREDPGLHLFRTSTSSDKVVIYERID